LKCLSKLAEFIGFPRDENLLMEIQQKCSLNNMKDMEKERDPGTDVVNSEQVSGLYRKGIFSSTDYIILYNTPYLSISIIFILLIL